MMLKKIVLSLALFTFLMSSCTLNKAKIDNSLKKYFDSAIVEGSFAMLNNQSGNITVYNMELDTLRVAPFGTFDLINGMIGIETGAIPDEKTPIKISGGTSDSSATLTQAFQNKNNNFFVALAQLIGSEKMTLWIDSLQYGNKKTDNTLDSFWLNNTLKISPDEQVGLMFRLYFDKLPFSKYAQQTIKNLMMVEDNTLYKYATKSGEGVDDNGKPIGWTIGWVEENRHVYFFATLTRSKDQNKSSTSASQITQNILSGMGFFKGQK